MGTVNMKYILVNKNGDIEEKQLKKNISQEELYKLCNYKNNKNFEKLNDYNIDNKNYLVYGKRSGRANSENKYEFPPPIDTELFFGNLCIVQVENNIIVDLTKEEWGSVYEKLFGGFEDIGESDEERSQDSIIYS